MNPEGQQASDPEKSDDKAIKKMRILAIDSSGLPASAAIIEDGKIITEFTLNHQKTHSQTLLPMIDTMFRLTEIEKESLAAVAVAKGPGSFTGLRIGSATAKGLGFALKIPVIEVSTLEALAFQMYGFEGVICPMMDARRGQVYTGLYRFENGELVNLACDCAEAAEDLIAAVNERGEKTVFLGDGVPVCRELFANVKVPFLTAKPFQTYQRAAALAVLAEEYYQKGKYVNAEDHAPVYLRMSQAERERAKRQKGKENDGRV